MNDKIRVGLIGYGYASKTFHAPLIMGTPGLELAAVSSSDETKVKADWPAVSVVSEPRHLFNDPHIDLIVIPTPNDTHFPLAKAALEAGKHVVVDKPFTVTLSQARELDALARSTGRVLSVFHNRRWDSDFLTLKALLADGVLGEVSLFESHFDRFRPQVRDAGASKAGQEVVSGTIWRRTCWIRPFNFWPAGQHDGGFSATASGRAVYRLFPRDFILPPAPRDFARYDAGRGGIRAIHRSWFAR